VYQNISFKPEQFNDYLMSTEIGFSSCKFLGTPLHKSKGCMLVAEKFIHQVIS